MEKYGTPIITEAGDVFTIDKKVGGKYLVSFNGKTSGYLNEGDFKYLTPQEYCQKAMRGWRYNQFDGAYESDVYYITPNLIDIYFQPEVQGKPLKFSYADDFKEAVRHAANLLHATKRSKP